jgi:hypothetical protein
LNNNRQTLSLSFHLPFIFLFRFDTFRDCNHKQQKPSHIQLFCRLPVSRQHVLLHPFARPPQFTFRRSISGLTVQSDKKRHFPLLKDVKRLILKPLFNLRNTSTFIRNASSLGLMTVFCEFRLIISGRQFDDGTFGIIKSCDHNRASVDLYGDTHTHTMQKGGVGGDS